MGPIVSETNEAKRLAALHGLNILDTPAEPEFDELVELAAAICEVPISLLSFLDDRRQWFKAAVGFAESERPIETTFCQYTIRQDDLFMVEDTTKDARFYTHPSVLAEPAVRFYAGLPIRTEDGSAVGAICVVDLVPRQMSATQIATLKVLARHANARLELREQRLTLQRALADAEHAQAELQRSQADLQAAVEKLRALAATDGLTGVANRRALEERLSAEFALARRNGRPVSVIMIDVDNFKQLNDRHGHEIGDLHLKQIASLLSRTVRENDLVARYGGEEFVILLPDTVESQAMQLAQRILAAIRLEPWHSVPLTVSGGIAEVTASISEPQQLLTLADERLYAAKHAGKDRVLSSVAQA